MKNLALTLMIVVAMFAAYHFAPAYIGKYAKNTVIRERPISLNVTLPPPVAIPPAPPAAGSLEEFVQKEYRPAVAIMYMPQLDGGMRMLCTATAIAKSPKADVLGRYSYLFVSAAHCVDQFNLKEVFLAKDDDARSKKYLAADVVAWSKREDGPDVSLIALETSEVFSTVRLGQDALTSGEETIEVSAPAGLGIGTYHGSVNIPVINRPLKFSGSDWSHYTAFNSPGTFGGSSGSTVICVAQRAVCAIHVGKLDSIAFGMPVSMLQIWLREVLEGRVERYPKVVTEQE